MARRWLLGALVVLMPASVSALEDASLATRCAIPRALHCSQAAERARGTADGPVMALRLSICRGDAEQAERLLDAVSSQARWSAELLFARGNLLLLQGRLEEARMLFNMLRGSSPQEGWGDGGLGLVALAENEPARAIDHLRAAGPRAAVLPEAKTAVLAYLERFWTRRQEAPVEDQLLALFEELADIRGCYRQVATRG